MNPTPSVLYTLLVAWMAMAAVVGVSTPAVAAPPAAEARTGVVINGKELTPAQYMSFARMYRVPPQPGQWWYDPKSGQFGRVGEPVSGLVRPGHDFGPLAADASRGTTGVFLNGRQLPVTEVTLYTMLLGPILPGRYWLDPQGNVGREGNPMPVANLVVAGRAPHLALGGGAPPPAWRSGNEWSGAHTSG
ncbi:MAG: hypothetical protein AAF602_23585, partial [Myxococcota bacterium]